MTEIDRDLVLSTNDSDTVIPQVIKDLVNSGRTFLGLDPAWHIYMKMNETPAGDSKNAASTNASPTYLNAHLEFSSCVEEEAGKITVQYVWHELLHVSLAELDAVIEEMFSFLPKKIKKLFRTKYETEVERFIQRTVRGMIENPEILLDIATSQEKSNEYTDTPKSDQ